MPTFASHVQCWSAGKLIYSKDVSEVIFDNSTLSFVESKSGKELLVFADCIVNI
jgi:hypothetical protein